MSKCLFALITWAAIFIFYALVLYLWAYESGWVSNLPGDSDCVSDMLVVLVLAAIMFFPLSKDSMTYTLSDWQLAVCVVCAVPNSGTTWDLNSFLFLMWNSAHLLGSIYSIDDPCTCCCVALMILIFFMITWWWYAVMYLLSGGVWYPRSKWGVCHSATISQNADKSYRDSVCSWHCLCSLAVWSLCCI